MYKRFLSMLLCLAMVLSFAVPVVNAQEVSATDSTDQSTDTDANIYLDGSVVVGDGGSVVFGDNNIIIESGTSDSDTIPEEPAQEEYTDVCTCGNADAALTAHADDCHRKLYYNAFCEKAAAVIYSKWEDMAADVQAYIELYLNTNDQAKWLELSGIIAKNAPLTGSADAEHDGASVNASGIPEGSSVTVQDSQINSSDVDTMVSELDAGCANELFTWDISVQDASGADWQPNGKVKLTLDLPDADLNENQKIYVMHKSDSGEVSYIPAELTEDGKITFETDGFSTFAGFTVDFEYDGVEFSINGYENILLSVLFEKLQMPLNVADVQEVTFTDYSLISIEKQDGDWLLTSLKAFQTTETLTIAMANGLVHTITVTDATTTSYPKVTIGGYGDSYTNLNGSDNSDEGWYLTDEPTNDSIDDSHTENYDIYVDATNSTNKDFYFVLQRDDTTTGKTLYLDLHTIWVRGGANVTIRLGSTITNDNTDKILIRQVPGRKGNSSSGDWVLGELFWIEDGSLEIRPTFDDQSEVRIQIQRIESAYNVDTYGEDKAFVALRENADYFRADQCDFMYNNTSAISVRSDNLSEFTMTDCTFTDCCASGEDNRTGQGGAIYVHVNPDVNTSYYVDIESMTLTNVIFNGTYAANGKGGAITYRGRVGTMLLDSCQFLNTYATQHGGAISIADDGDVGYAQGSIKFLNCTFTSCKANGGRGGAIRMIASSCTSFIVEGGTYSGCTASSNGGTISLQGAVSEFKITDASFSNSKASGARGGTVSVACSSVGSVTLSDTSFVGSEAASIGGAVHVGLDGASATISVGPVSVSGCTFQNSTANGGIGGGLALTDGTYESVKITDSTFDNCYSANFGGAVALKAYAEDKKDTLPFAVTKSVQILDCSFNDCVSGSLAKESLDSDGDGVAESTWDHDGDSTTAEIDRVNGTGGGGAIAIGGKVDGEAVDGTFVGIVIKSTDPTKYSTFTDCYTWNNGGAILLLDSITTAKVDLQYLDIDGCRARDAGNAIYLSSAIIDDLEMSYCTIQNCKYFTQDFEIDIPGTDFDDWGTLVYYAYDASGTFRCIGNTTCRAVIDNCKILNNSSYAQGGGIYWNANSSRTGAGGTTIDSFLKLTNSVIDGNYAVNSGGGMYVEATVTINACEFKNNSTNGRGGGIAQQIYNSTARKMQSGESTDLTLDSATTIHNNTANNGAGISISVSKTVSIDNGTNLIYPIRFTLGGASVYNNYATQNGGGIFYKSDKYDDEQEQREVDNFQKEILINDGKIYGNTAGYGEDNETGGSGGGIYMESYQINTGDETGYSKMTISEGVIYSNTAIKGNGGGIYMTGNNALCTVTGGKIGFYETVTTDETTGESTTVITTMPNKAIPMETTTTSDDGTTTTTLERGNGGGIAVYNGARIEMTGGQICFNEAYVGGGIAVREGSSMVSQKDAAGASGTVSYNKASGAGGGIAVHGSSTMSLEEGTISYNESAYGGGISVMDSTGISFDESLGWDNIDYGMVVHGGLIDNNVAVNEVTTADSNNTTYGGGICLSSNSTMKIDGGTISNNKAVEHLVKEDGTYTEVYNGGEEGGGIAVCQSSYMVILGGEVKSNAAYNGGGICLRGNSDMDMKPAEGSTTGCSISNNTAVGSGGGVYMATSSSKTDRSVLTITGGTLENNTAGNNGGGIRTGLYSSLDFSGGVVIGNTAGSNGGGVYSYYYTDTIIEGGQILNNTAENGSGGGICAYFRGSLNVKAGSLISGNNAGQGGGVYINGVASTLSGGTIENNSAENGGGLYVIGVENRSELKVTVSGSTIIENTASANGGGIFAGQYSFVDVVSGTDSNNEAVYGTISENTAMNGGGVFVTNGATLYVNNGFIIFNKATGLPTGLTTAFNKSYSELKGTGGGVYVGNDSSTDGTATFTLEGSNIAIYGNTADFAADDVYSSGVNTDLNLPLVGGMNLSGYPFKALGWVEDYAYMDSNYEDGLNQAAATQGISNGKNVYRYRFSDTKYRVMLTETGIDTADELAVFAPNVENEYVCLTLGTPSALPDTVVIDFGIPVNIDLIGNDFGITSGTVTNIGVLRPVLAVGSVDFTTGLDSTWDITGTGCLFGTTALNSDGTVKYTPTSMSMNKQDSFSYAVKYTNNSTDYYFYSSVTVIPATTIYYEDSFVDLSVYDVTTDSAGNVTEKLNEGAKWSTTDSNGYSFAQDENRVGAGDSLYGYDSGYDSRVMNSSYGSSRYITVSDTISARANFTFTGTGFDVISRTDVNTGCIIVTVKDHDDPEKYNKSFFVDTYFGYSYTNGQWVVNSSSTRVLYQVPVMNVRDLDYGTYDVEIYVAYNSYFDNCYSDATDAVNSYNFYLDAIRIYDPANDGVWELDDGTKDTTIQDAYISDGEYDPDYFELRDLILNPTNSDEIDSNTKFTGVLYLDGKRTVNGTSDTAVADYVHYGPNNEIYLYQNNSVAFNMNFSDADVNKVQIALRRSSYMDPTDSTNKDTVKVTITALDGETEVKSRDIILNSSTDLYHDISDMNGYTVVIHNTSTTTEEISITNVKVTHNLTEGSESDGTNEASESFFTVDMEMANNVVAYLNEQAVAAPTLSLNYPTVSFEDEIFYNVYFDVDDMSSVTEMGLITFDSKLESGTIDDALTMISGYDVVNGVYTARTNGIPAKNMGDAVYFKAYAKLTDGTYVYSDIAGYNAIAYANTVLSSDASDSAKALVVAMLNYGAAAQVQFGYNTDSLMNAGLTAEQLALVDAYSESMVDDVVAADSSKVGLFVHNGGYADLYPTVSFEGAFSINYYFETAYTPDAAPTFYYWDAATYASADELTAENATGTVTMVADGDCWVGTVDGIAAKQLDQTYYIAGVYTVGDTTYYSPVVSYSLGSYCETLAAQGNAFGAATAVYGYYAEAYFAN